VSDNRPVLVVFAGPNGSGKTLFAMTAYRRSPDLPSLYINADLIAKELSIGPYEAAVEAGRRRNRALSEGKSFVMETVMSRPDKIALMREAKEKGYRVRLEYVTTQNHLINVERVKNRVLAGGHDVPEEKVVARYERSMGLLPEAARIADEASVYDNSGIAPVCIVEKSIDGDWRIYPQEPPGYWTERRIGRLLGLGGRKGLRLVTGR
jgi:predicted ABC-type ATPase